jgi:hypothetical protein
MVKSTWKPATAVPMHRANSDQLVLISTTSCSSSASVGVDSRAERPASTSERWLAGGDQESKRESDGIRKEERRECIIQPVFENDSYVNIMVELFYTTEILISIMRKYSQVV